MGDQLRVQGRLLEPAVPGREDLGVRQRLLQLLHRELTLHPDRRPRIGLAIAWFIYLGDPERPKRLAKSLGGLYKLVYGKYFVDEIYGALIIKPLIWGSEHILWHVVDEGMIDGTVNGAADAARAAGGQARKLQSGNARSYATWVIIGAVGFTALLLGILGMRH